MNMKLSVACCKGMEGGVWLKKWVSGIVQEASWYYEGERVGEVDDACAVWQYQESLMTPYTETGSTARTLYKQVLKSITFPAILLPGRKPA
jgi:hypothetical protein